MVTKRRAFYIGLLAACVLARLATTIYYVEDTDSLRFALSVFDEFDLTRLQPHFPGYPVFWAAAKGLYLITGSFAISFSLIGGVATFAVVYVGLRLSRRDPLSAEGLAIAFVLFFNPMIWLMGNRYMPDLLGVALALGALLLLFTSSRSAVGGVLTGLLAGTRLSYLPLLLPAYAYALRRRPIRLAAATAAGVVVWLVPMLLDAGWNGLIGAATRQTEGHFTEFGGGVATDPNVTTRLVRLFESLWADGFGAWWPGRHWLTLIVAAGLVTALAAALAPVARAAVARARTARLRPDDADRASADGNDGPPPAPRTPTPAASKRVALTSAGAFIYTLWIFLFQNVIHKSRHVLPLVSLLAIPVGVGFARLARSRNVAARIAGVAGALAYAAVTIVLVAQHREPTAIAQVKSFVEAEQPDVVASIPLVNYYLSAQGVEAAYLSVHSDDDRDRLSRASGKLLIVGRYANVMPPNPARSDTFYHNPYVNRMWPEVDVYVYDR